LSPIPALGPGPARNLRQHIAAQAPSLKHGFHGYWSRRITEEHRLIHRIKGEEVRIATCRYHYGD